jgi:hypothetical protein
MMISMALWDHPRFRDLVGEPCRLKFEDPLLWSGEPEFPNSCQVAREKSRGQVSNKERGNDAFYCRQCGKHRNRLLGARFS